MSLARPFYPLADLGMEMGFRSGGFGWLGLSLCRGRNEADERIADGLLHRVRGATIERHGVDDSRPWKAICITLFVRSGRIHPAREIEIAQEVVGFRRGRRIVDDHRHIHFVERSVCAKALW
jgi:hypothetical protein